MNKKIKSSLKLLIPCLWIFLSCSPEVKEVEKIVEVEKTPESKETTKDDNTIPKSDVPKSGYLKIAISCPNDNDSSVVLTKDTAPINVEVTSPDTIKKIVWKKGVQNYGVKPAVLLADSTANLITLDENSKATFFVTENGWYDIVAEDAIGRYEWEQIEVKTIDTTPLNEVRNLSAICQNSCIKLSWNNPLCEGNYDSPLKQININYIYDNNATDTDNGFISIPSGAQTASIPIAQGKYGNHIMQIVAKVEDELGNESTGSGIQTLCAETIYATLENISEKLNNMTFNGKVVVSGAYNEQLLKEIKDTLKSRNIKIILDLSTMTGMTKIPENCFKDCTGITEIVLPEGIITLEAYAFKGCTSLQTINIPDGVTTIDFGTFMWCSSLINLTLPDSVTIIGGQAFYGCRNIKHINIPSGVTILRQNAFQFSFAYGAVLTIPSSVNKIELYALQNDNCVSLVFEDTTSIWKRNDGLTQELGIYVGTMTGDNAQLPVRNFQSEYYKVNDE